ncbi:P-loop containing nucleoside triphosphate hydrolase protein [Roridomyces roridus]|uniref:P-loop containing nucleoside triphosphate hydrolase protein n=1 Tax=Roridomyces roridus TaxID=1738132 RepID=A0AAD7CK31_9AGAR|nr:P-loop containing nucleoside triphosphate hydrolase protein [Roridomyces roridus]
MPSIDNAPEPTTNGVETPVKVNGVNGVDTPAVQPTPEAAAANGTTSDAATPAASTTSETPKEEPKKEEEAKKEEEDEEEKEIKARKAELDALNKEYSDVPHGSKTEVVHLDKRWDKNGDEYYIRQKKVASRTPGGDWWERHVLVVIRHFEEYEKDRVEKTTVEIYSEHLRKTLSKVIKSYPGISFQTEQISLTLPVECLYHYMEELGAEAETLAKDSVELDHLKILLDFIQTQFAKTIEEVSNLRPQNLISYSTLWTLFRPGTIIHSKVRGYDRAFELQNYWTVPCGQHAGFYQHGTYTDYDGANYGTRMEKLKIPPFAGSTSIATLPFAPLDMRTRRDEIRAVLMKRGKRFQTMKGQSHGEYAGVAIEEGLEGDKKFSIKSRVMIDGKSYNRICADHAWEAPEDESAVEALFWAEDSLSAEEFTAFKAKLAAEKAARELTDQETLLATNVLRGFSFTEKRWFLLFIDNYSEIVWNEASFDRLVLPEGSKTLIRALVSSHLRSEDNKFDDIIKGKGRGLVTVLHGNPGVGKTLTAECIAEYTRRPLYVVSSGDLGTSASNLERELTRILDLAHTWRAVLLIDEADVFLEKRTLTDVHRNALVSVFLRLLEYYEGILFLTTNRVNTFDPAFQSRIHMALKYENLETQARKRLWKDFLSKLPGGGALVSEEGYDVLAGYDINGRQIKNAVKTAESLAAFMGKPLGLEYLETVLKTQADFAEAFVGNEF